jgi:hypothetical protein
MKHLTLIFLAIASLLLALPAPAQNTGKTWYVSQITGSNQNDGSRERPLKNIQRALDLAASGDVIRVAEGKYYGLLNSGNIKIDKGISIFGGYASDFSERDVLSHRTFIQPSATSNGTAMGQGTVQINVRQTGTLVEIDGLILDRGQSVAYHPRGEGRPEGVETGMMQPVGTAGVGAPGVPEEKVYTNESALVYINTGSRCDVTLRNCAFLNGPNYGILGSTYSTKITIDNCIFVNIRMAAVELRGASAAINSETYFKHNTVLFVWSRLKDLSDMGYGFRYMPKMDSYLDHNIIGCCILAGLDRTHVDSPAAKEAERVTTCENSLFFLNRQTDLTLPGGGLARCVSVDDFDDVDQLKEADDNEAETDPSIFGGAINEAYLKGFLDVSSTRMFANHYPVEDALKLFGAVSGYGAQKPK